MPRKRKATDKEDDPKITVRPPVKLAEPVKALIRCIWDSRLIVGGDKTPSGTRYEFMPAEEKPVLEVDYQSLLAMETRPFGCCGGSVKPQKFFEEV